MRRRALILTPLLALALVTGCSSTSKDKPADTPAAGGSPAAGNSPAAGAQDDAPCVVGEWQADADALTEAMGLPDDPGTNLNVEGSFDLRFTDSDFDWHWAMTMSGTVNGSEGSAAVDATLKGTWSGPDDDLTFTMTDATGTMTSTENGQTTTENAADSFTPGETWTATCSGSTMTVRMDENDQMTLTRK